VAARGERGRKLGKRLLRTSEITGLQRLPDRSEVLLPLIYKEGVAVEGPVLGECLYGTIFLLRAR
jgi:hypothetical protein